MSWETVLDEKKLTSLGWVPVPSINGKICHTWADITQGLERNNLSSIITGDWVSEPVVIKNQNLFKVRKDFVDKIAACSIGVRLILDVRKNWQFKGKDRVYHALKSHDPKFTDGSVACSSSLDGLVEYQVPQILTLTKLDVTFSFGNWYTAGHIETRGDDSITHEPLGKKFMLVAKRGNASRRVESLLTSVNSILNLLAKPLSSPALKETLRFYFSDPKSLMIQPALCSHTVITTSSGPALVVGLEVKMEAEGKRCTQILQYYATGLGHERRNLLLQKWSDKEALTKLTAMKKEKTALYEHLECLQHDKAPKLKPAREVIRVPKRKKRMFFLVRRKYEQKVVKREGNSLVFPRNEVIYSTLCWQEGKLNLIIELLTKWEEELIEEFTSN